MAWKRPESVLVVVHTRGGEVLLLRRRSPPDFWQSVTGSLEWDEPDPRQTARRELAEETGLGDEVALIDCRQANRFPILPAWRRRYAPGVMENLEHVFRVELPAARPVVLNPDEHTAWRWLPRDRAAAMATSYTNRDAILRFVPGEDSA